MLRSRTESLKRLWNGFLYTPKPCPNRIKLTRNQLPCVSKLVLITPIVYNLCSMASFVLLITMISALGVLWSLDKLGINKTLWRLLALVFITNVVIVISQFYSACSDGWTSHSIGKQGACSWHGGVVSRLTDTGWVSLAVFVLVVLCVHIYTNHRAKRLDGNTDMKNKAAMIQSSLVACPLCDARMVRRNGKFSAFYGCSHFPKCKGIRRI